MEAGAAGARRSSTVAPASTRAAALPGAAARSRRPVRSIATGAGHASGRSCRLWRAPAGCARASTVGRARRGARGVKANRDAQRESIAPAVGASHAHAHVFAHPARRGGDTVVYRMPPAELRGGLRGAPPRPARRSPRSDCCCSGCCCARCHALAACVCGGASDPLTPSLASCSSSSPFRRRRGGAAHRRF